MWDYTEKVMDHFLHPRNVGEIAAPDAVGEVGNITCGDALKLFLQLDENGKRIANAKFQTFGCASAIASASALTEIIKGMSLEDAAAVTNDDIADFLGSLPEEKMHCSVMGMEALQEALKDLKGESGRGAGDSGAGASEDSYDSEGLDRVVCYCFSVTERHIREIAEANDLREVDDITHYCKAGGGCGKCRDEIESILNDMHGGGAPTDRAGPETAAPPSMTNLERITRITEVIDNEIAPGLKADGGNIELVDIDRKVVLVRLTGACAGCPGAHLTLKRWVEARLRDLVDEEITVVEETDS